MIHEMYSKSLKPIMTLLEPTSYFQLGAEGKGCSLVGKDGALVIKGSLVQIPRSVEGFHHGMRWDCRTKISFQL